jgi:hypothetical protein
MQSDSVIRNLDEAMRDCLHYAKKARNNPNEFKIFIERARRWQAEIAMYASEQEARRRFLAAYHEIMKL